MDDNTWQPMKEHAFQVHVGLMRTHSRGKIELRSSNPADSPRILVNYLKDKRDRGLLRKGIHLVRELLDQSSFSDLKGEEMFPGSSCTSDSDLDAKLNSSKRSVKFLMFTDIWMFSDVFRSVPMRSNAFGLRLDTFGCIPICFVRLRCFSNSAFVFHFEIYSAPKFKTCICWRSKKLPN